MITKAKFSALILALALGAAVTGCSGGDEQDGPEPGQPEVTAPTDAGSATASPSKPTPSETPAATPSPSTEPPEPKPPVGGVGVLISNSEWDANTGVTVRGYANTVDTAATCTLDLTQGGTTRSVTGEALENPTTMSCGELTIGAPDLSPGDWTAVLSYTSPTAWGTSAPVIVTVP